jgi:hypothetical protein
MTSWCCSDPDEQADLIRPKEPAEGQIFADAGFDNVTIDINVNAQKINTDKTFFF